MESFFPGKKVLQNRRYQTKQKRRLHEMKRPLLLTQVLRLLAIVTTNSRTHISRPSQLTVLVFQVSQEKDDDDDDD